ncbi:hypothetical protein [Nostoc sp. ChiQUE01b]|uniref:hypothetical protein n=1 Tax=Nostoc sp. ChiQUE01b TaxID=3075376 RepID=UPI002AD4F974|nr:hypothetical protein [Nostoc sp. ChiQUE01b]MDZ8261930.1 hypothetical protein [Nostoc sp. ChiQUE01b]
MDIEFKREATRERSQTDPFPGGAIAQVEGGLDLFEIVRSDELGVKSLKFSVLVIKI